MRGGGGGGGMRGGVVEGVVEGRICMVCNSFVLFAYCRETQIFRLKSCICSGV